MLIYSKHLKLLISYFPSQYSRFKPLFSRSDQEQRWLFSLNYGKDSGDEVTWTDLRDASEVAPADVVIDQRREGRAEERMILVYETGDEMDHDVFIGPGIKGM